MSILPVFDVRPNRAPEYNSCMDAAISVIADGLVIVIALIAAASLLIYVPNTQKLETYSYILMAGMTAYLLAKLVASVYQPAELRPFELLGVDPGASYLNNPGFPSDHMLFAVFLTITVWFATRKPWLTIALAILTIVMGVGRVLALVHTPLDIVGGAVIAALGCVWYLQALPISAKVGKK